MIALLQRVDSAKVISVNSNRSAAISKGILVFLGIHQDDSEQDITYIINKLRGLKLFEAKGKYFARTLEEEHAQILVVSQFTLYAALNRGTKPSFTKAMAPSKAEYIYNSFCDKLRKEGFDIETGEFGAHMKVKLTNDGPVTFILSSDKLRNEH
jgi:D-tyrosyl-tRNA(Tyr) deacylase